MTVAESQNSTVRQPQIWPLPVEAYHALGDMGLIPKQTELLYGQIFLKMSKSPFHSYLIQVLQDILQRAGLSKCFVRTEQPITCIDSEPEPDLAVIQGKKEDFRTEHPHTAELIIEVYVTSHIYDRTKLRAYANAGVKECWLVLAPEKKIEVYRQPSGDQYAECKVHDFPGRQVCSTIPDLGVELSELFA